MMNMINELNASIDLFPVTHVLLAEKTAIITRQGELEIPAGTNKVIISKFSRVLKAESMHITILDSTPEVSLQNPVVRRIKPEHVLPREASGLQERLANIRKKSSKIARELSNIKQKRITTKNFLEKAGNEFLSHYSEKAGKFDPFVNLVNFVESFSDTRQEEIKLKREQDSFRQEEKKVAAQLGKLKQAKEKEFHELVFSLVTSQTPIKIKLQARYRVPAKWKPSYDLKITGDTRDYQVEILFWGIIENQSEEDWENVNLELGYTSFGEVSVEHPLSLSLERGIEGKLDVNFQKYGTGKSTIKGQTTEFLAPMSKKVSVPADEDTHAYLMHSFTSPADIFYYWNAAETDYIVIGTRFTNGDIDLLAGDCSFFKEGKIIGRGKLPALISFQKVNLPLAAEPLVIATKKLLKQENPSKKRFLLHYKLQLVNKRQLPVKIQVLDVLPISKHPRSDIGLLESEPAPVQAEKGLLKWIVDLKEEWDGSYTVEIKGK